MDWERISFALDIMWKGMLGIFVVILLIMIFTMAIGYIGNYIEDRKSKASEVENGNQ